MGLDSESKTKPFVTKLIVQGLLMLLESDVAIRCRAADVKLVESCLAEAQTQYANVIKTESGVVKQCKLTLDKSTPLSPDLLGGVVLACHDGKITIDNDRFAFAIGHGTGQTGNPKFVVPGIEINVTGRDCADAEPHKIKLLRLVCRRLCPL